MSPTTATPAPATNTHTLRFSRPPQLLYIARSSPSNSKEEAIVKGPVEAVWQGLRRENSYKEGWQVALDTAQAET